MPADPSGSLYLSRIADFSAAHPVGLGRRRLLRRPSDGGGGGGGRPAFGQDSSGTLNTTAQVDPTLRQSQVQGVRRRGSALMQSTRGFGAGQLGMTSIAGGDTGVSTIFQSAAGMDMARTAVLGDSQGSVMPGAAGAGAGAASVIPEEELAADGGVGSMLGESYVDGRRPGAGLAGPTQSQLDAEEELEDGGVLGLLAQIYGTGANVKGRGRGPPRAI